ncbi:MAG: hypothetical protein ACK5Y2_14545 [Bdellovibrionales bacterium]
MKFAQSILLVALLAFLQACQISPSRTPSSAKADFDSAKVNLLKWAAKNRILFQIHNDAFEDVHQSSISNSCKRLASPAWTDVAYQTLETLKRYPDLQDRIHIVEVKRASEPGVATTRDLDGVTYLVVSYSKLEKKSLVAQREEIPCDEKSESLLNQELLRVSFDYPSEKAILKAVRELPKRDVPDRWKFKTQFLTYLAERQTIFRINPELTFERSPEGDSFLASFLNTQADLVAKQDFSTFDYWLHELSVRSHSGSYLKFFMLNKDKDLNFGMGSLPESRGLSYPFLTYKVQEGRYTYPTLTQLDRCLSELSSRYRRSLASVNAEISTHPETFLSPGYTCR